MILDITAYSLLLIIILLFKGLDNVYNLIPSYLNKVLQLYYRIIIINPGTSPHYIYKLNERSNRKQLYIRTTMHGMLSILSKLK